MNSKVNILSVYNLGWFCRTNRKWNSFAVQNECLL